MSRYWLPDEIERLRIAWGWDADSRDIARFVGRSRCACTNKAAELKLPHRKGGAKPGVAYQQVPAGCDIFRHETAAQAAAWRDVVFSDAPVKAEPPLRGLPPINHSPQSSMASVTAGA